MEKKLYSFFVLLLVVVAYGQTTRFVYDTSVNPDSINLVSLKSEKTFLDVKDNRSLFISENKLIKDSLFAFFKPEEKENNKKERKELSKPGAKKTTEPTFFDYYITKNIAEQKVYFHDQIASRQIYYQEDRPVKWEITNVTEQQNGYPSQKATAYFGGRTWTAWFTKSIAISDGPYKFSGLPGLIVKLEDDKGDYKFDLIKKINIKNAFEEPVNSDAKLSTRIDFKGDMAALELEAKSNRRAFSSSDRGGKRGGGMSGGGMRGNGPPNGMGMPPGGNDVDGMMQMSNSSVGNSTSFTSEVGQNPIELK
ncbi:GLPGLI family protein [Chryseobacterium sp. MYb264]|uniref:GLPGLI family protein n=1 Tax=Chryseobacterium sp. MYb264 TaxID=2745153 RepID=UPI002E1170ED|nr:GLPGLI family protein [Chryseobacterium sp. MYb264]